MATVACSFETALNSVHGAVTAASVSTVETASVSSQSQSFKCRHICTHMLSANDQPVLNFKGPMFLEQTNT